MVWPITIDTGGSPTMNRPSVVTGPEGAVGDDSEGPPQAVRLTTNESATKRWAITETLPRWQFSIACHRGGGRPG